MAPANNTSNTISVIQKWKRFNTNHPFGSFIVTKLGEGLFSGIGSLVVYIAVFIIIYKWFKTARDNDQNAVVNALQYRMPGLNNNNE